MNLIGFSAFETHCLRTRHFKSSEASSLFSVGKFQHAGRALSHQGHGEGEQTLPLCAVPGPWGARLADAVQFGAGSIAQNARH